MGDVVGGCGKKGYGGRCGGGMWWWGVVPQIIHLRPPILIGLRPRIIGLRPRIIGLGPRRSLTFKLLYERDVYEQLIRDLII